MLTSGLSRIIILVFGILYPAYSSYKAIRSKDVKAYVRWMMHWVVFACFQLIETFSDVFLCWFPFYYEAKVCIVFWLLSPMTKGSSILYKKFIHPKLSRHEQEIDDYINQAKTKGYTAVIQLGTKSFDYASKLIVETAIKASSSIAPSQMISSSTSSKQQLQQQQQQQRHKKGRDATDSGVEMTAHVDEVMLVEEFTMCTGGDNSFVNQGVAVGGSSVESLMQNENIEFSDIDEPLLTTRARTRSQSTAKESSQPPPPAEIKKRGRVKRTGPVKIKGRKPIVVEPITSDENEEDDDN